MYFKDTYAGQTQHHSKLSSQQSSSQVKQSSVELQNRQKRSRQIQIGTFSQTHMLVTKICCFWPRWEIKAELNEQCPVTEPRPQSAAQDQFLQYRSVLSTPLDSPLLSPSRLIYMLLLSTVCNVIWSLLKHTQNRHETQALRPIVRPYFPWTMDKGERGRQGESRTDVREQVVPNPTLCLKLLNPNLARSAEIKAMYALVFCMSLPCNTMSALWIWS